MSKTYSDHISSIYKFANSEYKVEGKTLSFNNINLPELIKKEGSPLKVFYLPKVSTNISKCNEWFKHAIKKASYKGKHHYSYCTKSNHFLPVIERALSSGAHLEISSSFDFKIIDELIKRNEVEGSTFILCNGFKTPAYIDSICKKINQGYTNTLPIIDNIKEIEQLSKGISKNINIGLRLSTEERSHHSLNTSRFGIAEKEFTHFNKQLQKHKNMRFIMLHFFINSGITDTSYYWNALEKKISFYCKLKPLCPDLKYINIGGGLKTHSALNDNRSHKKIIEKIVSLISSVCQKNKTDPPDIFTEFGNYTVSNCACTLYSVIGKKQQENPPKKDVQSRSYGGPKCHTEYKTVYETIYKTIYKQKCNTVYEKKCKTFYETKYITKYDKKCSTIYVPKCSTVYETIYEKKCKHTYEKKVSSVVCT
ncbi:MAG TPA: arginine decarboxylase [Bacteroidetes bacterium]|nr:arginine decarboxylase [Bacteroidota bacterium]